MKRAIAAEAEAVLATLRAEGKFFSLYARAGETHLLEPQTFMNASGKAVAAVARFYKIQPDEILVVHDELDLPPGQQTIVVAFAALPTASSAYVLAARMGYNGPYVAGLVTLSTVLGVASLPFALGFLR